MPTVPESGRTALEEAPILLATNAMGTRFEALIAGVEVGVSPASARAAGEDALALVRDWHRRLSVFDRASVIARLNREAGDGPVRADAEIRRLLRRCVELSDQTGGAFDITAGALMRRWGFRDDDDGAGEGVWGLGLLDIDDEMGTVEFLEPGVEIDLGGVAKGAVLDEAVAMLREYGVTSALLHGGTSTIVAIGAPPGEQAWRVRVGNEPGAPIVDLRDAAMSVSAPSGRTRHVGDDEIGHIMDPRAGRPADRVVGAACVGVCALDTDAWSTALAVLGERPSVCPSELTTIIHDAGGWRVHSAGRRRAIRIPKESSA
ncbi:MAG: FAD:protein FMN transferase [Phycisphaerales bacterium]